MPNLKKFVHSADKLGKMRTKFHIIQAKLINYVRMVLHCAMYCHLVLVDGPHVGVLHGEGGDLGDLVQADQPGTEDGLHTGANR